MNLQHYRLDIQGLRAIAVLAVVGFHGFPNWLTGGFIGVDIFFVISGYVISRNIFDALYAKRFSITDFYSRRILRIFPALIVVLFCVFFAGWKYMLATEFQELGKHIAGAASFIENILYFRGQSYFDDSSLNKPLLQLWSLSVEEQFYIFWPILLWLLYRYRVNLYIALPIVIVLSFFCSIYGGIAKSNASFFLVQYRVWELGLGSLLAVMLAHDSFFSKTFAVTSTLRLYAAYPGILCILIGIFTIRADFWFPGWWALLPTVGAFLIILGSPDSAVSRYFLSNPVLVWFGKISYPLYLWHWVLFSFAFVIYPEGYNRTMRISLILISILLSWFTFQLIEKPFRNPKYSAIKVFVLLFGITVLFISGLLTFLNKGYPNRYFAEHYSSIEAAIIDWTFPKGTAELSIKGNTFKSTSGNDPTIAFIGDSHMNQYGPRILDQYRKGQFQESIFLTFDGCPPIPNVFEDKHPNCQSFISKITNMLDTFPSIKTVVIGGCWNCYFLLETQPIPDSNNFNYVYRSHNQEVFFRKGQGAQLALVSLESYLSVLTKKYTVYLIVDNQMSYLNDPRQLIKNRLKLYEIEHLQAALPLSNDQKHLSLNMQEIAKRAGAKVIDPLPFLCPEGRCPIFSSPGIPIFKDNHHLRSSFVIEQAAYIDRVQEK